LQQIIDKVDEMEDLMVLRRNPALADDIAFEPQMRSMMSSVASELNVTFESKYLFAGTRTNRPPVTVPVGANVTSGVPDDGYYQGSKTNVILRADDNVEIEARVRADNSAFQKIFAAANQAIEGHGANDDDTIAAALDLLQEGLQQAIAIEATINADILSITNISERQSSLELYWTGVTEELSRTDILSISTKLAVDETILQASFQAFAGINQLRLVNYL
jgi:flagellin-like hook-associated protein FlgL